MTILEAIRKILAALFGPAPAAAPSEQPVNTSPGPVSVPAVQVTRSEADLLRDAMDRAGITDNATRAGIAAIAMGESNMRGYTERGYGGTSNARIREVFGSRVAGMSDAALNVLKADDRQFFNFVYGPAFSAGRQLGNTQPGDGYRFRGRGLIQLTGKANYARYGAAIGKRDELLANPDMANDPAVSALLTVAYIKDRYHGGGWDKLLACVGNNTPDIRATKTAYYSRYLASGEFAVRP